MYELSDGLYSFIDDRRLGRFIWTRTDDKMVDNCVAAVEY
jgi:hypothetical protein